MRDTKSLSLLLLSSVLFLLSIVLLCTWGYQYYHQIQEDKTKIQATKNALPTVSDGTRDSLLKIYQVTMQSLDNRLDTAWYYADSLKGNLDINLKEFYRLRDEIATLLQTKSPNVADLELARKKISELQQKVTQLRYRNNDVETENARLKALLEQMSKESQGVEDNSKLVEKENKDLATKINTFAQLSAANLNLVAMSNSDQDETNQAGQTEKLVGSFTVKSNMAGKCDVFVVVVQPDGQVLQKSAWESGTFENINGAKRIYSCKLRCEISKGEPRQLNFSLTADKYYKGEYIFKVYHNGVMIGKVNKTLS
jgi:chromosome segregation ATPase